MAALGQEIARRIGEARYQLWFASKTRMTCEADRLLIGVPNHFFQDWLQAKFGEAVREAARLVLGGDPEVLFRIDPALFQEARKVQAEVENKPSAPASQLQNDKPVEPNLEPREAREPAPRRWRRLDQFVVGPCNRVAYAAALNLVEMPGQGGNPLVLHGPVGTGKSHLLEGIYAGLKRQYPHWRIVFVTCEEFTNRFIQAMRLGKLGSFRKSYRDCDVLLIDDIHFLATKKATKEEFLHTLDVLFSAGKQVVLTCDCHPRLTEAFPPELVDRLLGGSVWGLQPPDSATRFDLLQAKKRELNCVISDDVLRYLAENLRSNVRELEGAMHSLRHFSLVTGRSIDLPLAREALAELLRHAVRVVQLEDVDRAVCTALRLPPGALQSKQRAWAVSHPRMLAMYLARKHTAAAYSEIGRYFGGRNHSTAVAAEKKVRQWLESREELVLGERHLSVNALVELLERELVR